MKNRIIKEALFKHDLRQHQLAELLGIHETSLSRKMRRELPEEEQIKIANIIEEQFKDNDRA